MNTSNALDPQSPQARAIYDLGIVATIVFVLIFVVVAGGIAYAIFRFRGREGEPEPNQFAGSERVEIIWTAIPFLIVVFLFVLTLRGMNRADPPPAPSPDLVVTGHQFWWQADYPASGVVTANESHIPAGKEKRGDECSTKLRPCQQIFCALPLRAKTITVKLAA